MTSDRIRIRRCFYNNSPECLKFHDSGFTIPARDHDGGMFHIPICPECLDHTITQART